jgi:hypothetical protein
MGAGVAWAPSTNYAYPGRAKAAGRLRAQPTATEKCGSARRFRGRDSGLCVSAALKSSPNQCNWLTIDLRNAIKRGELVQRIFGLGFKCRA